MGTAYRRNWKNLTGKDDVTGHEVLTVGSGLGTAAVAASRLPDPHGVNTFAVPRAARLEGLVANLQGPALASADRVGLALWAAGAVVASGTMTAGGNQYLDLPLKKEDGNEVTLSAGQTVFVDVATDTGLTAAELLSVRVHLAMLE